MPDNFIVPSDHHARQELAEQNWWMPTDRGMELVRPPTWDEWEEGIGSLAMLHHNLPKIIGDYVNIGEDTFGERYAQAIDVFGEYAYGTIANYASICRSVPYDVRHPELTMAHYKAVRTLSTQEQIEWQDRAVENNWNTHELWEQIHGGSTSFFTMFDRILDDLAILQGQCQAREAVEHITLAFVNLRHASNAEATERNVYDLPTQEPTGSIEAKTP